MQNYYLVPFTPVRSYLPLLCTEGCYSLPFSTYGRLHYICTVHTNRFLHRPEVYALYLIPLPKLSVPTTVLSIHVSPVLSSLFLTPSIVSIVTSYCPHLCICTPGTNLWVPGAPMRLSCRFSVLYRCMFAFFSLRAGNNLIVLPPSALFRSCDLKTSTS